MSIEDVAKTDQESVEDGLYDTFVSLFEEMFGETPTNVEMVGNNFAVDDFIFVVRETEIEDPGEHTNKEVANKYALWLPTGGPLLKRLTRPADILDPAVERKEQFLNNRGRPDFANPYKPEAINPSDRRPDDESG